MQESAMAAFKAFIAANEMAIVSITALFVLLCLLKFYWEKVGYFTMRIWHGVPLIGTVSRSASKEPTIRPDGWTNSEYDLCNDYYEAYGQVDKSPEFFRQCQDYLKKIGEAGRRPRPAWVFILAAVLLVVEAVGFGYVLSGWLSLDASASDKRYQAIGVAILLAVISCGFAEAAGHAIHHNSLIKKARAWWRGDASDSRSNHLKQIDSINIEDSFSDSNDKDYNRILSRIATSVDVTPKYLLIGAFVGIIMIMAVAAFVVRAKTLDSIQDEMVNSLRAESAQSGGSTKVSPFELPDESKAVNDSADNKTIDDKMQAIREASLTTYLILSVIYIAIQCITCWLASIFGFAGVHSRRAYNYTHKFNSADEMVRWMERERTKISGHADHKLSMLQQKLSTRMTNNAEHLNAMKGSAIQKRDFNAYVMVRRTAEKALKHGQERINTTPAPAIEVAPVIPAPQPVRALQAAIAAVSEPQTVAPVAVLADIDANTFHDLTSVTDEQLPTLAKALKQDEATLKSVREQQLLLKQLGIFKVAGVNA